MIYYRGGFVHTPSRVFRLAGSMIPKTLLIALGPAIASGVLQHFFPDGSLSVFGGSAGILLETQAWSGFSFLVGFLVVFRTSQAYSRFWEGCTAAHQMRAEWFDACSAICAFTKHSNASSEEIKRFKELLIRLVSMLHAAALAELEKGEGTADVWANRYHLIDPESIDSESLETLKVAEDRVELLFEWIQQLIVENLDSGVLSIAPPILSRCFQELANGMVAFHNAMKIAYIPIPFPYAQTCDLLLIMNTIMAPIVTSQWVTNSVWAAIFTIMHVSVLWSLNLVALEIENPFGRDANDIDGQRMQGEINRHLLLLLKPSTNRTPRLSTLFDLKCTVREQGSSLSSVFGSSRRAMSFADGFDAVTNSDTEETGDTVIPMESHTSQPTAPGEEPTANVPMGDRTHLSFSGMPDSNAPSATSLSPKSSSSSQGVAREKQREGLPNLQLEDRFADKTGQAGSAAGESQARGKGTRPAGDPERGGRSPAARSTATLASVSEHALVS